MPNIIKVKMQTGPHPSTVNEGVDLGPEHHLETMVGAWGPPILPNTLPVEFPLKAHSPFRALSCTEGREFYRPLAQKWSRIIRGQSSVCLKTGEESRQLDLNNNRKKKDSDGFFVKPDQLGAS